MKNVQITFTVPPEMAAILAHLVSARYGHWLMLAHVTKDLITTLHPMLRRAQLGWDEIVGKDADGAAAEMEARWNVLQWRKSQIYWLIVWRKLIVA